MSSLEASEPIWHFIASGKCSSQAPPSTLLITMRTVAWESVRLRTSATVLMSSHTYHHLSVSPSLQGNEFVRSKVVVEYRTSPDCSVLLPCYAVSSGRHWVSNHGDIIA